MVDDLSNKKKLEFMVQYTHSFLKKNTDAVIELSNLSEKDYFILLEFFSRDKYDLKKDRIKCGEGYSYILHIKNNGDIKNA